MLVSFTQKQPCPARYRVGQASDSNFGTTICLQGVVGSLPLDSDTCSGTSHIDESPLELILGVTQKGKISSQPSRFTVLDSIF